MKDERLPYPVIFTDNNSEMHICHTIVELEEAMKHEDWVREN